MYSSAQQANKVENMRNPLRADYACCADSVADVRTSGSEVTATRGTPFAHAPAREIGCPFPHWEALMSLGTHSFRGSLDGVTEDSSEHR